jgi:hypothetical protein
MSSRARLAVVVGGAIALWGAAGADFLPAQGRFGPGRMAQPKLPDLHVDGTVEAVRPGLLQVVSGTGQTWVLRVAPDAKTQITGKATPDFLGPGQCIAFVADVDVKRSRVEQPVTKITLFNPSLDQPLGAGPDQGLGGNLFGEKGKEKNGERGRPPLGPGFGPGAGLGPGGPGQGLGPGAGAGFGGGADAAAIGTQDARGSGRRSKSASSSGLGGKAAPATQSLEVRGQITSNKGGKVTLHVPNAPFKAALKIEIADSAEIDVQLSSPAALTLAQKGDKVRARGLQLGEAMGQAREIELTLGQTLGAAQAKKRPPAKTERTPRSKKAPEADEKAPGPAGAQDTDQKPAAKPPASKDEG